MSTAQQPNGGQQSWRDRKYAGPSAADREARQLTEASILAAHAAGVPQRFGDGREPAFDLQPDARAECSYMNDVARSIGLSFSGRLTDPATGKCEFCDAGWRDDKLKCPPSPPGGWDVHWRVFDKDHGRAHVVDHYGPDPENWHYHRQSGRRRKTAETRRQIFGAEASGPIEPDPPPSRAPGAPPPRPEPKPGKDAKTAPDADEGLAAKLRRWTS
jgi:hypothetical protein